MAVVQKTAGYNTFRKIDGVLSRVEQHREIAHVMDLFLNGLVAVEVNAHINFAVFQAKMSEAARSRPFLFVFFRVHQDDDFRTGLDWRN